MSHSPDDIEIGTTDNHHVTSIDSYDRDSSSSIDDDIINYKHQSQGGLSSEDWNNDNNDMKDVNHYVTDSKMFIVHNDEMNNDVEYNHNSRWVHNDNCKQETDANDQANIGSILILEVDGYNVELKHEDIIKNLPAVAHVRNDDNNMIKIYMKKCRLAILLFIMKLSLIVLLILRNWLKS